MANWKNLDTLKSYQKLAASDKRVDIKSALAGEEGAARVAKYSIPMAGDLVYNYAAKQVDDEVLSDLAALAEEAELADKFKELLT